LRDEAGFRAYSKRNASTGLLNRVYKSCLLTTRSPNSRARIEERVVDRFMKLTHAISRMKTAMAETI